MHVRCWAPASAQRALEQDVERRGGVFDEVVGELAGCHQLLVGVHRAARVMVLLDALEEVHAGARGLEELRPEHSEALDAGLSHAQRVEYGRLGPPAHVVEV